MNVILSFATESASSTRIHDLFKEAAEYLTAKGLKGNFHLTGDFARALRQHARRDVIRALARHEIGYHCNHHGGRPFMAGYCEQGSWQSGVSTWLTEELPGIRIIEELFGRAPAYYTTEFAKAPQVIYGSWLAGIPTTGILLGQGPAGQSAEPLPDGGQGAAWYCNSFVPTSRYLLSVDPQHAGYEQETRQALANQAAKLANASGVLRAFMHAYMLIQDPNQPMIGSPYKDTYYEDMSFGCLPEKVIANNIAGMKIIFTMIADHPGALLVGFSDYLADGYRPGHGQWLTIREVDKVAHKLADAVDAVLLEKASVSPAEAAGILTQVLRNWRETKAWPKQVAVRSLIGPTEERSSSVPACSIPTEILLAGLKAIDRAMGDDGFIPAGIDVGGRMLGPGQWLQCLAGLYIRLRAGEQPVPEIACPADSQSAIANAPFFQQTVFTRKIYPGVFTGERICRLARLQAWSWKPACRRNH